MLDALGGFIGELRAAGLPVSLTETIDAVEAVRHVDLVDRPAFKAALAATLVKRPEHRPAFETVFAAWFPVLPGTALAGAGGDGGVAGAGGSDGPGDDELAALLEQALAAGDPAGLARLARLAVARFAGMEAGRPAGLAHYVHRTLRQLDADRSLARLLQAAAHDDADVLEARLRADHLVANVERLRAEVEAEVGRRLVADRGAAAVARSLRRPLPEDVDFMHATRDDVAALRRTLHPLARRLAVRLARRRRHRRRGALDFRSTVRHSLSYGGAPAEPRFRHRHPSKPELAVVADVSGSVAAFARFTLQFVHALSSQFSRVRSFAFVDGIDEVTGHFEQADDFADAVARVSTRADVVWGDGHSDYGQALAAFWQRFGRDLAPRTTVVVLGDARNNYHAPEAWALAELRRRVRHVWWLNPEPRSYWDTGDSIMSEYAPFCDGVFECRNLRQLERFVEQVA